MRNIIVLILLFSATSTFGQKSSKWQLSFQLQPELTFHKNDYAFRWNKKYTKSTFNIGVASLIQYNITKRVFIEAGLAFISRKLNTKAFVDQSLLPPPYYDSTLPLYITRSVSLRTLQFPIGIGVYVIKRNKTKVSVKGNYIPDYLLSTRYDVNNYPGFRKNYWQGYTLNAAIGMDYQLNKKITFSNSISYSFKNTVTKDYYLFSQDERTIALPHKYLQLSTGVKIDLKQH